MVMSEIKDGYKGCLSLNSIVSWWSALFWPPTRTDAPALPFPGHLSLIRGSSSPMASAGGEQMFKKSARRPFTTGYHFITLPKSALPIVFADSDGTADASSMHMARPLNAALPGQER